MKFSKTKAVATAAFMAMSSVAAHAAVISNADFETGDLSGWNVASYNGGTTDFSTVRSFDTDGVDTSNAAAFRVGAPRVGTLGGITLSQDLNILTAGTYNFAVDVATAMPRIRGSQLSAGVFEMLVNGTVVDTIDFGRINSSTVERGTLEGAVRLSAGTNSFSLRLARSYFSGRGTPVHYVDNIDVAQVPLPAGLPVLLIGLGSLALVRRRAA